jgi:polyhydroxyalkanoate synthesis regulator phasin
MIGDGIKKFVLMGIGAAAMTVEKSQQMVDELVKKGELTVEQGKELNQELKRNVRKTIDEAAEKKVTEEKKEVTLEEKIAMMSAEELENLKAFIEKTEASPKTEE